MLGIDNVSTSTSEITDYLNGIKLFPNPTSSKLLIENKKKDSMIEVYTVAGTLLQTIQPFQKEIELDIESYKDLLLLKITLQDSKSLLFKKVLVN